jgi:hypothetical protein
MLTLAIALQGLKSVGRRRLEIIERVSDDELIELPSGYRPKVHWTSCSRAPRGNSIEDVEYSWVRKGLNHERVNILTHGIPLRNLLSQASKPRIRAT